MEWKKIALCNVWIFLPIFVLLLFSSNPSNFKIKRKKIKNFFQWLNQIKNSSEILRKPFLEETEINHPPTRSSFRSIHFALFHTPVGEEG